MRTFVVVAALAVAACSPPAEQSADQPAGQSTDAAAPNKSADQPAGQSTNAAAPDNCNATAPSTWAAGSEAITVEASSAGADCASAEASITLRRGDGGAMYSQVFPANQIRVLAGADSVADMELRNGSAGALRLTAPATCRNGRRTPPFRARASLRSIPMAAWIGLLMPRCAPPMRRCSVSCKAWKAKHASGWTRALSAGSANSKFQVS